MSERIVTISKGTPYSIECYEVGTVNDPVITVEIRVPLKGPGVVFYRDIDEDGNMVLTLPDATGN